MPVYERAAYEGAEVCADEVLRVEDVSLSYELGDQHIEALRGVSCSLAPGEFVLIQGATGTGKSSLLGIMSGMLSPETGEATLGREPLSTKVARGSVGLIFQDSEAQLFADSVLADVAFGPRNFGASEEEARERAVEALQAVGLDSERFGDQSPFVLSGGEARRAAIAGIIALKPRFLLADEPTSALDASGRNAVRKLLAAATREAGVVVVTHSPEQFQDMATQIYTLEAGRLIEVGKTEGEAEVQAQDEDTECASTAKASPKLPIVESSLEQQASAAPAKSHKKKTGGSPITFGSFVPGSSFLHKADPRTKITVALVLMIALFISTNWLPILAACALVIVCVAAARISPRYVLKTLRPIAIILVFTLVVNAFRFAPFRFVPAGFERGLLFALRIMVVMMLSTLVTLTTSPVRLTDGITALLAPMRRIKLPVDDLAMMLSIALRFIPTIFEEAQVIIKAQTMRGAHFNTGSLWKRLRAWIVILVPLLVQLFRRAETLALAMEARCYTGVGRTRLRQLKMRKGDWVALLLSLFALALIITGLVLGWL
jgi:energy-coupling factor transport system ATP-binding protein